MNVEVRRPIENAVAHHAAALGIWLRRRHLELRPVVLVRDIGGKAVAWSQTVRSHHRSGAGPKHVTARPIGTCGVL